MHVARQAASTWLLHYSNTKARILVVVREIAALHQILDPGGCALLCVDAQKGLQFFRARSSSIASP
jgi:hypothetical protein